ncbi:hypothetical protein O6H91_04G101700 [Diphasiastrum complanatum]|nr:hypothetical protein O6H91_04G101700 [Diphasiastrum complanatum]
MRTAGYPMENIKSSLCITTLFVFLICVPVRASRIGKQILEDLAIENTSSILNNLLPSSEQGIANGIQFDLIRKESLNNSQASIISPTDPFSRLLERLRKSKARVESLKKIVTIATGESSNGSNVYHELDWRSPVSSALSLGDDEYLIRLGVGTPAVNQYYLAIDTGSDITWLQCAGCSKCYSQRGPLFNPASSSSYQTISCESSTCRQMDESRCQSDRCQYAVTYGDGSFTTGDLAMDTLSSENGALKNMVFGCGHDNEGLFQGIDGLAGLGGGYLSFTSQLAGSYGRRFSYCLVNQNSPLSSSSSLIFGADAFPSAAVTTPLIYNSRIPTFYYASVTGISINGVALNIDVSKLQLTSSGSGGLIIDSGTTLTYLESSVYSALTDGFLKSAKNLRRAGGVQDLDTCFDLSGTDSSSAIPTISFHFQGGVTVDLPSSNILIEVDNKGIYCLAFSDSDFGMSIFGNVQQQTFRIGFDRDNKLLSFSSSQCK